ncbi:MAG: 1-acyl-sn-glycerol-3-phosphate acyltransferase [bacterium]|nr:1-acyl-sn-glycerol-3-phosphate acyltransferase [bacterium]
MYILLGLFLVLLVIGIVAWFLYSYAKSMVQKRQKMNKEGVVFYPRDETCEKVVVSIAWILSLLIFLNPKTKFMGKENIREIRRLHKEGKRIIFTLNHLSHLDHAYFAIFARRCGFWDIWRDVVFVARNSLYEETEFSLVLPVVNIIGVYSAKEIEKARREKDREKIRKGNRTNKLAKLEREKALAQNKILVIYTEGGRSDTEALIKNQAYIAPNLRKSEILGRGTFMGTEKVFPRGYKLGFDLFRRVFNPVTFTIGAPYPVPDIADDGEFMNCVGVHLAELLWPEYQGYYKGRLQATRAS